jgi:hypothetical protein
MRFLLDNNLSNSPPKVHEKLATTSYTYETSLSARQTTTRFSRSRGRTAVAHDRLVEQVGDGGNHVDGDAVRRQRVDRYDAARRDPPGELTEQRPVPAADLGDVAAAVQVDDGGLDSPMAGADLVHRPARPVGDRDARRAAQPSRRPVGCGAQVPCRHPGEGADRSPRRVPRAGSATRPISRGCQLVIPSWPRWTRPCSSTSRAAPSRDLASGPRVPTEDLTAPRRVRPRASSRGIIVRIQGVLGRAGAGTGGTGGRVSAARRPRP